MVELLSTQITPVAVPGREAIHTWDGRLVLGDPTTSPAFLIEEISGRDAKADHEDRRTPRVGQIGETPRRTLLQGKTEAWRGSIYAGSLAELRRARALLLDAFSTNDELRMDVAWHPDYRATLLPEEQVDWFFHARCIALSAPDMAPKLTPRGLRVPFTLALRLSDPRYYQARELVYETGSLDTSSETTLPVTAPFTVGGGLVGAVAVSNPGTAPVDPVIDIHGPATAPELFNDTVGAVLRTRAVTIPADSFLQVDFRERRLLLDGQSDYGHRLDRAQTNWWDEGVPGLAPGENLIRLRGGVTDPAKAVIRFHPASY